MKCDFDYLERLAREIYDAIGKEHAECVYHRAMEVGLRCDGIAFESLRDCPVTFRGMQVGRGIADIVTIEYVIELKATTKLNGNEERGQLENYMRSTGKRSGIIINFGQDSGKNVGILEFERLQK